MAVETSHSVAKGVYRLLHAPRDLRPANDVPWREPHARREDASPAHGALFDEYKERLAGAMFIAVQRWQSLIAMREQIGMTRAASVDDLYKHSPAGPAACPQLVWTLRDFWLHCDALNCGTAEGQRVPPQVFLLGWLIDEGGHHDWVQVMTAMPYWPIGLDVDGLWV